MSGTSGDVVDVSTNEVRTNFWQDLHEKAVNCYDNFWNAQ